MVQNKLGLIGRWTFLFVVLLLTSLTVQGQKFYLGVKAGGALPTQENFDFSNKDSLESFGYHGGAMAAVRLKKVGLQGELLYAYNEFKGDVLGIETNFKYTRIALPVVAKFYFPGGLNFQFGARLGFLIKAESEDEDGGFTFDISNTTNSNDVGLQLGLGYELPLGLTVDARYNIGLTEFPGPDSNLAGPEISIGYNFLETGGIVSGIPTAKRKKWKGK